MKFKVEKGFFASLKRKPQRKKSFKLNLKGKAAVFVDWAISKKCPPTEGEGHNYLEYNRLLKTCQGLPRLISI